VEFCAETFGAKPLYGYYDPDQIETEETFDLIWCGSVFTHLDAPRWEAFLRLLTSLLRPYGLLILTTAGRMREKEIAWLPDETHQAFEAEGFGYAEYPDMPGYGQSLCSLLWALRQVEPFPLQVVMASENAWGGQDVIACQREPGLEAVSKPSA
jgi:SAM-dependent methyltransferase